MPLPEDRRKQLDDIVGKMTQNQESDSNIQSVVSDFKKKYDASSQSPTPMAPPSAMGKTTDSVSRQLLNGLTFGFGDNMEAALGALPVLGDKKPNESYAQAYDRNLREVRGSMGQFQKENPKTALALDVAGGMLPAVLTGGSSTAATAPSLIGRVGRSALLGATYGALGNAGNSNVDTAPELLKQAGKGAAWGAASGAAMPVIASGLRRVAEDVADSALGIGMKDRRYGKTPAAAILDETSGISPATIEESARNKMGELQAQMAAAGQGKTVDIGNAQRLAQQLAYQKAGGINQPLAKEMQEMADSLSNAPSSSFHGASQWSPGPTGQYAGTISANQSVPDASRLKRDFSDRFVAWNSDRSPSASQAGKQVYRALDNAIDSSVPEAASLNQRISSLIPVAQRAEAKQLQAGAGQRALHRIAAHTGAGLFGAAGYHFGGPLGAAAGLVVPEVIASPTAQMGIARGLNYPTTSSPNIDAITRYLISQGIRILPSPEDQQ